MAQVKYTYLSLLCAVYTFCPHIEKARKIGVEISMPEMVKQAASTIAQMREAGYTVRKMAKTVSYNKDDVDALLKELT